MDIGHLYLPTRFGDQRCANGWSLTCDLNHALSVNHDANEDIRQFEKRLSPYQRILVASAMTVKLLIVNFQQTSLESVVLLC